MICETKTKEKRFLIHLGCIILISVLAICAFLVFASDTAVAATSGDYDYQLVNNGTEVEITGYHGLGGDVEIPSVIDGKPITSIGNNTFSWCQSLTSVTIPSSVTTIGIDAFYACTSLTAIDVNASNPNYASIDGVLYNKTITGLIQYPGGRAGAFTIPSSVTTIGRDSFAICQSMTSVTIPNSVTTIGRAAFQWCTSLTSVTIGSGVTTIWNYAFYQCTALTSVTIGSGVTSIGDLTFYYCTSLTSITIPSSVTSIGDGPFVVCTALTAIDVNADNANYASVDGVLYDKTITTLIQYPGGSAGAFTIPSSVTTIGYGAFYQCTALTSVTIPSSVTSIGDYAFESCSALTSVTIPSSVTTIGNYAFFRCTALTSVTIGSGVTSIGDYAFNGCTSLTSITFLGLVAPTTVGIGWKSNTDAGIIGHAYAASNFPAPGGVFNGLTMGDYILEDYTYTVSGGVATITGYTGAGGAITIPSTLGGYPTRYIGDYAFQYTSLTSVTIPDSVISIGAQAFYSSTSLISATIPSSVTSIGSYAFGSCDYLTSVTIGNNVTTIGYGAFQHCISLTSVIIPNSVTSLASTAFSWCNSLTSVTIGNNVHFIEQQVFQHCTSLTSVTIPSKVTGIGVLAFESCSALTSVTIPNSVTSIDYAAFSSCALSSVTIPGSVTMIGEGAFSGNPLTSITFLGLVAPTSVGTNWILNTDLGIRGHAYAASNFPAPGGVWNGLTMGAVISVAPVTPGAPTGLTATPGNAQVTLTWQAPASNGGSPLTEYKVFYGTNAHPNSTFLAVWSENTSATISGLETGIVYYFNVVAMNAVGNSTASPDLVTIVPISGEYMPSVSSTSNVSGFTYNASKNELTFSVSGAPGTTGKTRIFVPSGLVGDPAKMTVKIDGNTVNYERSPVAGGWALEITYVHSTHAVVVAFGAAPGEDSTLLIVFSVVAVVIVGAVTLLVFRPKKKKG